MFCGILKLLSDRLPEQEQKDDRRNCGEEDERRDEDFPFVPPGDQHPHPAQDQEENTEGDGGVEPRRPALSQLLGGRAGQS